jgi:hypothetical protein
MNQTSNALYRAVMTFGILVCAFAASGFYKRASIDINGQVTSSQTTCVQPQNNRCSTVYRVKDMNGVQNKYVAGFTDGSLPLRLPVGAHIEKKKWQLTYALNGRSINDFPLGFYGGLSVFGLILIGWSAFQWRNGK